MAQRFQIVLWMRDRLAKRFMFLQRRRTSWWRWSCLLLVTACLSMTFHWLSSAATATIQPPLSTKGAQIVDATGQTVLLRGVNWFGMETELQVPHGLWARDYKDMLAQIKRLGYNVIRLPYSVQGLRASGINGVDFSIGSNKDLEGKTPLEVMDLIIQEAQRQGLMILLDSHRLNNQRIPELWYGDGFTEADWIDTWKLLATRYKNQPNVIGADLKNEPHGRASWGTNDKATDWRLAAERAGNAILTVNPNWLIVVEGVERNVPGQKLKTHWMGGNLEGVGKFPVRLSNPKKLVYSPHEYGPGVFNQAWFSERSFPKNLRDRWEVGFNYIATRKLAPILIGEFGGRQVDESSKEGIWQRELVNFIQQKNLSFAYWSWNPNSTDTGGILQDDWSTVNQPKQQLLSQLLPVVGLQASPPAAISPNPAVISPKRNSESSVAQPSSTPSAMPPKPSASPTGSSQPAPMRQSSSSLPASSSTEQLKAETLIQSDWQTGFCVGIQVANPGSTPTRNWELTFQMNQAAINQSWNGSFIRQDAQYKVQPANWAKVIQPNQRVNLGFCANKLGGDYLPKQVTVANL